MPKRQKQIRLSEEGWHFLNVCKQETGFTDTKVMEMLLAMYASILGKEKKRADAFFYQNIIAYTDAAAVHRVHPESFNKLPKRAKVTA